MGVGVSYISNLAHAVFQILQREREPGQRKNGAGTVQVSWPLQKEGKHNEGRQPYQSHLFRMRGLNVECNACTGLLKRTVYRFLTVF